MNFICHIIAVSLLVTEAVAFAKTETPPNIVIILADDLGYGDVKCYNPDRGKIPTPNLDHLASEGMRFTDAHSSSAVCSPSRYTLLTGRYHWRTRLQSGIVNRWEEPLIAPDRLTIAGLAKQNGYRTACIGKWHLGWDWPANAEQRKALTSFNKKDGEAEGIGDQQKAAWRDVFSQSIAGGPITRGFDYYFGTDVPNWPPYCFIDGDRSVGIPNTILPKELLRNHMAAAQGPALPGWNFECILPDIIKKANEFITTSASTKQPFLLYLPLTTPHTPLAVNKLWRGRSGLDIPVADLVMETDDAVGKVLETLERNGVSKNTLVIVTSDNGMASYTGASELEAKGHYPSGPLRGYKGDSWEGGHRIPFIVRWPGVVKAGTVNNQLAHHADIMATIADILSVPLPPNSGEDSVSLLPLMRGNSNPVRTNSISAGSHGVPSLRVGQWKLIAGRATGTFSKKTPDPETIKLFNLAIDLGETMNLAEEQPERLVEMQALLEKIILEGRSTPGPAQANDVTVRRFPNNSKGKEIKQNSDSEP